jgi:hypothetical protein
MISKLMNKLSNQWLSRFAQTSIIYIITMLISLLIGSIIGQHSVFYTHMLIIVGVVIAFNFINSLFYYFKLHYLHYIISSTLVFASFSSILLAIENFNGSGYFQGIVTLVLFLAVAFVIGIVAHLSMYLITGERSLVTIKQDQPLLRKLFIAYMILLIIITAIIIYSVAPSI